MRNCETDWDPWDDEPSDEEREDMQADEDLRLLHETEDFDIAAAVRRSM